MQIDCNVALVTKSVVPLVTEVFDRCGLFEEEFKIAFLFLQTLSI